MELGGWKSYEMVLRYRHVAQEKLNSVAERIGRQPVSNLTVTPPTENVAANGTFSIRSVHRAPLDERNGPSELIDT